HPRDPVRCPRPAAEGSSAQPRTRWKLHQAPSEAARLSNRSRGCRLVRAAGKPPVAIPPGQRWCAHGISRRWSMSEGGDKPQWVHKTFRLKDLRPFVEPTAYDPNKVMRLRESIRSTGYWDNMIGREVE